MNNGDNQYSALIDAFISESSLTNTEFPLQANGSGSFFFLNDNEFFDTSSINNWKRAAFTYLDSAGIVTRKDCAVYTLSSGIPGTAQAKYQQSPGTNTVNAINTGEINQTIQIYGDASHGNFTKDDYLVVKYQENGYKQIRVDIPDLYSQATLKAIAYPIPTPFSQLSVAIGDPNKSLVLVDHTAAPLVVGGKSFSYEVQEVGITLGVDILREINYNLAQGGSYLGKLAFNLPDIIGELGDDVETVRGYVEDDASYSGFYVSRSGGDHPDFTRFQSDDGTYYTPLASITYSAPNLINGSKVRLYNVTQARQIEISSVSGGGGYSRTLVEGTDYDQNDEIVMLAAYSSGATAKRILRGTGVATTSNIVINDTQQDWEEYNDAGADGSDVPECSTNYSEIQVEVTDSDNSTEKRRIASFIAHSLTTNEGIAQWVSLAGVPVIDYINSGTAVVNVDVANLKIDNIKDAPLNMIDAFKLRASDNSSLVSDSTYTIRFDNDGSDAVIPDVDSFAKKVDLTIVNNGVKKASKLVVHEEDLT